MKTNVMVALPKLQNLKEQKSTLNSVIKNEVQDTFGRRIITSRDCLQLSEEIYFKTAFTINANTLRRFFGLVKAEYPPSISTLNILTKYCGFTSIDDINIDSHTHAENSSDNKDLLNYLSSIFKLTQVKDPYDETFLALVKHTIHFLSHYPEFAEKFQRAIAKTKNGQTAYYENFVHMDKLNSFYGNGIRYYINEAKTNEAKIFGNGLLCLRYWLTDNKSELKKNFEFIKSNKLTKAVPPVICSSYLSSHLYYADAFELNPERILDEAHALHVEFKKRDDIKLFECLEYNLCLALVITSHFEEGLFYINYTLQNFSEKNSLLDQGLHKKLLLLKSICLCRTGYHAEAERIYQKIRPSQFHFLSKKSDTILYLLLSGYLKISNQKLEHQMAELIEDTGFHKLNSLQIEKLSD